MLATCPGSSADSHAGVLTAIAVARTQNAMSTRARTSTGNLSAGTAPGRTRFDGRVRCLGDVRPGAGCGEDIAHGLRSTV